MQLYIFSAQPMEAWVNVLTPCNAEITNANNKIMISADSLNEVLENSYNCIEFTPNVSGIMK